MIMDVIGVVQNLTVEFLAASCLEPGKQSSRRCRKNGKKNIFFE